MERTEAYVKGAVHDVGDWDDGEGGGSGGDELGRKTTFQITGLQAEDYGSELLYADYKYVDVSDEMRDGEEAEEARILVKTK